MLAIAGNYSTQFVCPASLLFFAANALTARCLKAAPGRSTQRSAPELYAFAPSHIVLALTSIDLAYGSLRARLRSRGV